MGKGCLRKKTWRLQRESEASQSKFMETNLCRVIFSWLNEFKTIFQPTWYGKVGDSNGNAHFSWVLPNFPSFTEFFRVFSGHVRGAFPKKALLTSSTRSANRSKIFSCPSYTTKLHIHSAPFSR